MPTYQPKDVTVGSTLQVQKIIDDEAFWREAEVLAIRAGPVKDSPEFYVHYTNFNKRLDEWVSVDRLNLETLLLPKAESKKDAKKQQRPQKASGHRASKGGSSMDLDEHTLQVDEKMSITTEGEGSPQLNEKLHSHPEVRSKAEEIEALRRGGSMTQRPEEVHRVKNISHIVFGHHQIETWYFSPYPPEFDLNDTVYICEFCLSFYNDRTRFDRHRQKCNLFHPPGNELYRKDNISFFEIDGHKQRMYCRNLCLLSKLFLDHKTLYYDANPFLFYVMTQNDELGCHIVGYFSKEKESAEGYNVACILTLPNHQRKGYGRLLIAFSYELSKLEGKLGSPEKPLSDLGLLSYRSFWTEVILTFLFTTSSSDISIDDLASLTSLTTDDILHTMQALDLIRYYNGQYIIVLNEHHRELYDKMLKKKQANIDPTRLDWKPPQFSAAQLRYI